jgi:hypothetical protein
MERDLGDLRDPDRRAAGVVADRARELAPRQSGRLAGSIRVQDQTPGALVAAGGALVPYAGPIHFGWRDRNIEPQPFLTDAQAESAGAVAAVYAEEVADLVRRIDRETPP